MSAVHRHEAFRAAAEWYARLTAEDAAEADRLAWQHWKDAHEDHARAWERVEEVTGYFHGVPASVGMATLNRTGQVAQRRRVLKQLAVLIVTGTAAGMAYRQEPWRELLADHATEVGEQREILLADGTRMHLNTDTAIDISFDDHQRRIRLIRGEMMIETGHETGVAYRPFIVETRQGACRALGTRFSVRQLDHHTRVGVYEHAVEITPAGRPASRTILQAGDSATFDAHSVLARGVADPAEIAWSRGFLVVDGMPLGEFARELARYRNGMVHCEPQVASLKISGAFPIRDTDAVLTSITQILPVSVRTFTRYWINLVPA